MRRVKMMSLNVLISQTHYVCLRQFGVRRRVDARVRARLLREPYLRLVVDSEVRQLCLNTYSDLLADVSHL